MLRLNAGARFVTGRRLVMPLAISSVVEVEGGPRKSGRLSGRGGVGESRALPYERGVGDMKRRVGWWAGSWMCTSKSCWREVLRGGMRGPGGKIGALPP